MQRQGYITGRCKRKLRAGFKEQAARKEKAMFIRAVTYEVKPGMMEEAEQVYHTLADKSLKTQKGFERGYAIVNSKTGMAVTFAVWASKEDFDTFNATKAGKEMSERVSPLLANPPVVAEFDRMIQP
jgi:quinol monooxygenase YgiN